MKKINDQILEESINYVLDSIKKLYPVRINSDLKSNIASISVVVDNLEGELIENRYSQIVIDEQFFDFDENGNIKSLKENNKQLFILKITYSILRAISKNRNYDGITDLEHFNYKYLNDGITQAITEEITGNVLSIFTDVYKDYKKIAKIIKLTVGNEAIIKSYFDHTSELKQACNILAKDSEFFDELNRDLFNYGKLLNKSTKTTGTLKQAYLDVISKKIILIYKKIIINLVIPKLKQLKDTEKKKYLKQFLVSLKDDVYISNKLENILKELMISKKNIVSISNELKYDEFNLNEQIHFLSSITDADNNLDNIVLQSNGDIFYQHEEALKQVTNPNICRYVYDKTIKLKQTRSIVEISVIKDMIKKGGINISFGDNPILNKRQFMESLKNDLVRVGLYMLNECHTVDDIDEIIPNFISMNKVISYEDLKKIANQFNVIYKEEINDFEIFDRVTNKIIFDDNLKKLAKFAYIWVNCLGFNYDNYYLAFDKSFEPIYDEIITLMRKNIDDTGNINSKALENYKMKSYYKSNLINKLLSTSLSYRILYEYLIVFEKSNTVQIETEKSISEKENDYYDKKSSLIITSLSNDDKALKF